MNKQVCLGLDIGTTTISAVVLDGYDGALLVRRTVKSEADIPSPNPKEKVQDAAVIEKKTIALLEELLRAFPEVGSIGITGQMHGIVYLDGEGRLLSPLYTWQDQRAAPYCAELQALTGYSLSPGYGLATHFALRKEGQVPAGAAKICTIMDYLGFVLSGRLGIHSTNAASLGLFNLEAGCFDERALKKAGISPTLLPEVITDGVLLGYYREIPVAVAIGDNQASFLGSVAEPETTALANFGTGSQISLMTRDISGLAGDGTVEVRPFLRGRYLVCGSALCGGRAYALLEGFFRAYAEACGLDSAEQYPVLNRLAAEGLQREDLPRVSTTFCGTRSDPSLRGSVLDLGEANFMPAALTAGVLLGMAEELYRMFAGMPGQGMSRLAASGNAVRKNPALMQALEQVFGVSVCLPAHREEAAFGAALFAGAAAGYGTPEELGKKWIRYAE